MESLINCGAFIGESQVNGPGSRSVIWVQGCSKNCPGCYNHEFREKRDANLHSVSSLYRMIMDYRPHIDGVTFSGGEPFDQAKSLYELSLLLKMENLNIVSYSGYTLNDLKTDSDPFKQKLLGQLDILIDGPYIESRKTFSLWRGSSNQKVYYFNKSLLMDDPMIEEKLEIIIDENGNIVVTGTFAENVFTNPWRGIS